MDTQQRKVLESEINLLQASINHLGMIAQMNPYDSRAVEAALKSIEGQCAFMRQYTVSPRTTTSTAHHLQEVS